MDTGHYERLQRRRRLFMPPAVPLAVRQLRQTWRLLLFITLGIVLTSIIVCAVPLYTQVTEAASLRNTLLATPTASLITTKITSNQISKSNYNTSRQYFADLMQRDIGRYLAGSVKTELSIEQIPLTQTYPAHLPTLATLIGAPPGDANAYLHLVAGTLPQATSSRHEVAVSQEEARDLGVSVGATLQLNWPYYTPTESPTLLYTPITLTVVGIYAASTASDPYWTASEFGVSTIGVGQPPAITYVFPLLTTSDDILSIVEYLRGLQPTADGTLADSLNSPATIEEDWHAYLDPDKLGIEQLDDGITRIANLNADISTFVGYRDASIATIALTGDTVGNTSILTVYRNRNGVPSLPLTLFLVEIIGLVLLFVGVMTELLVGRQTNVIVILRSRGASRADIFGALSLQSVAIGAITLITGPLLAVPLVIVLAQNTIPASDLPVLRPLQSMPLHEAQRFGVYALLLAVAAVITMFGAIWQVARSDILALRREAARSNNRPLWQRLNLDVLIIVAAFVAFGLTTFVNDSGILNATTSIELAPLVVVAPLCLVLATSLLFLRFLTLLLQGMQSLAARGRGAAAPIALALVTRAPRQVVRMTLLLALATALILFTQIFTASQNQRIFDVAAYQAEADISGTITATQNPAKPAPFTSVAQWTKAYRAIPGVQAATVGFTGTVLDFNSSQQLEIQAVDADTFAQTAIWPKTSDHITLPAMMSTLASDRQDAIAGNYVPAYVDESLWNTLRLRPDQGFTILGLSDPSQGGFAFKAAGEITHLPPAADSSGVPASIDYTSGGLIVDYATVQTIATKDAGKSALGSPFSVNTAWLKTSSDANVLAKTREDLSRGDIQLTDVHDRRAIIAALLIDPAYLAIVQVLQLGAFVAFILTVLGSLLSSWLDVRNRLTNFALFRALGAAPRQIAQIFLWEQGIIYVTAIALGLALGLLLAVTVIPSLVFTSGAAVTGATLLTNGEFYAIQRTPAIQVIVPASLLFTLLAFILVCTVAIWGMTRVASRPSISQTLRLNED